MSCFPFTCLPFTCSKNCVICNKSHNKKERKLALIKDNTINIKSFANVTMPTFKLLYENTKQEVINILNEENNISKLNRVIISYKIVILKDMYNELVSYLNFELTNISNCNIYCVKNADHIYTDLVFRFNIVKQQLINFNIFINSVINTDNI